MSPPALEARFATVEEYLQAHDREVSKGGLLVRGATLEGAAAMSECTIRVLIGEKLAAEVPARVAATVPGIGVAVMFEEPRARLADLAERLRAGEAPGQSVESGEGHEPPGTLAERLRKLNASQKMALALSCDRETRMALLRDTNKVLHIYVLKNPRIGLDEVLWAAKMPTLSPDAIKLILENKEWASNANVCTALARNPKTPLPLAVRLLDKIPLTELRTIAKGGARDQLVHAARKKVNPV
jgi:hypothetical protein